MLTVINHSPRNTWASVGANNLYFHSLKFMYVLFILQWMMIYVLITMVEILHMDEKNMAWKFFNVK